MDRLALISDIHGNIPALEATLDDIDRRGISRIFCLGDLVGKGPCSDLAVDICRERCERIIRGNWDEGITTTSADPAVPWHQARLGPERLAFLKALPATIDFIMSGRRIRLVHASPQGVSHRVFPNDSREKLLAMFDSTDLTGPGFAPDVVGYGDIHTGFVLTFQGKMLFNVGSVGNPLDLPLACYAILEGASDDATAPLGITLVQLPYDIERAVREATAEAMPDLEPYVNELRTARYRGR